MILYGLNGTFEITLPEGYQKVASGEVIIAGDLYLEGHKNYTTTQYLEPVWKLFENPTLTTRVVSPEMIIIRETP